MNINVIGGALGVAVLVAILILFGHHAHKPAVTPPAPITYVPLPEPKPAPAPVAAPKPESKPVIVHKKVAPKPVRKLPVKKLPAKVAGPKIYKDNSTICTIARRMVLGKSQQQLEFEREKYQVTPEEIAKYQYCFVTVN